MTAEGESSMAVTDVGPGMAEPPPAAAAVPEDAVPAGTETGGRRGRALRSAAHPAVIAVLTWLVLVPPAVVLPTLADANPFVQRSAEIPLAVGMGLVAVIAVLAWWLSNPEGKGHRGEVWVDRMAGVAAGALAAYVVLVIRTALHGTPFAIEGVFGDTGRLSAMAVRYTTTWKSTDGLVVVPSEYPPLFPFLVGKASILTGVPAWRLLAPAEIITVSGSILAGFTLWLRLTRAPVALAIASLGLAVFGAPDKAYEVIVLVVFIPWVLMTIERPARGALHWLPAGLIGGAMFLTYYAYAAFAGLGVVALVWARLRPWGGHSPDERRAYLEHLLKTAAVVLAVLVWWLIPYVVAMVSGGQQVADMYEDKETATSPLTFLEMSPLGLVQLVGVISLVWYWRTAWWARPLAAIVLGALAYRTVSFLRWVGTEHSGLFYYTVPLITSCLVAGALLGLAQAAPEVPRRLGRSFPRGAGVVALATAAVFAGYTFWGHTMPANKWLATDDGGTVPDPTTIGWSNKQAAVAHLQRLPDGTLPEYAPLAAAEQLTLPLMPVAKVQQAVAGVLGANARPYALAWDEQIFAFLPWKGYLGVDRNASYGPVRWPDRYKELTRLADVRDPAAFAQESGHTRFGPIDVFILRRQGNTLTWKALRRPETLVFQRSQFDPAVFSVVDLPDDTTVAIRRAAPRG